MNTQRRDSFRILVIEEDEVTGTFIADNLMADGYQVELATTLTHARHHLGRGPQGVIADLNGSTLQLVDEMRDPLKMIDAPLIVLGSGLDPEGRIRLLERGADDTIAKPFSYPELRARLDRLMERTYGSATAATVAGLCVDIRTRQVTFQGKPIPQLSNKAFTLLSVLAQDPHRVFTKAELLEHIWGRYAREARTRTLDSHACRLRNALREATGLETVINTWGIGYRLMDRLP